MTPNWTCTHGRRGLLTPDRLLVLYLPDGGSTSIISPEVPRAYRVFDLKTGDVVGEGRLPKESRVSVDSGIVGQPRLVVFCVEP